MVSSQGLYKTLGPGEIRVLDVRPGQPGSACECDVRIVQLGEHPSFHALSYTWGTGSKEVPVYCGSHVVLVTMSLSQALQRLRKPGKIYTVWIDQICINQEDLLERNQQVKLMGQIYTVAQTVDVWLGEASDEDDVGLAMEFIPRLVQAYEESSESADGTEEPNVIQRLGILVIRSRGWEAVEKLVARPYFRRVWIVQEASLGKVVNVHCGGPYVVDWHSLVLAARCIASSNLTNRDAHNVIELIQNLRKDIMTGRDRPLVQILSQVYSLLCGNALDRVYGVLGLIQESRPKGLEPDYELSIRELFIKTAQECVETDQTLAVLSNVRSPKSLEDLPSWVPDWTCSSTVRQSIGLRGRLCDHPVMDLGFHIHFISEHTLVTLGVHLGSVGHIGSIMPEYDYDQDEAWLEWKSLAEKHSGESKIFPRNFWQTVIAHDSTLNKAGDDELENLYVANDSLRTRNRITAARSDEYWEPPEEMSIVNSRSVRFGTLMAVSHGRRMFTTTEGEIGLGPPSMKEADQLCLLHGSITPLILRKESTDGRYRLVGESYVFGVDYADMSMKLSADVAVQYSIV